MAENPNVYETIRDTLILWGIIDENTQPGESNLADWIFQQLEDGTSQDQVWRDIKQTDAYRQRFPGMEYFDKQMEGFTEGDYINRENQYKEQIRRLGLNYPGFTSRDYLASLMVNEISVDELKDRVNYAEEYIGTYAPQSVKDALRSEYGLTDMEMVEYMLNPEANDLVLDLEFKSKAGRANVLGAARDTSMNLSDRLVSELAEAGTSYRSAIMGLQEVAAVREDLNRLAAMDGQDKFTDDELAGTSTQLWTSGSVKAKQKKKALASKERARFSGSSGAGRTSLGSSGLGSR
jgi:hypothetical protein